MGVLCLGIGLLVDQEAHQQGVNRYFEHRHEDERDAEGSDGHQYHHKDRLLDVLLHAGHEGDEDVEDETRQCADQDLTHQGQNPAHNCHDAVSSRVCKYQSYCIVGS